MALRKIILGFNDPFQNPALFPGNAFAGSTENDRRMSIALTGVGAISSLPGNDLVLRSWKET